MGRLRAAGIAGYNLGASCQVREGYGGHGGEGAGGGAVLWERSELVDLALRDSNPAFCRILAGTPSRVLAEWPFYPEDTEGRDSERQRHTHEGHVTLHRNDLGPATRTRNIHSRYN